MLEGYAGWNAEPQDKVTVVEDRLYLRLVGGDVKR
jgi:hypothetical protein